MTDQQSPAEFTPPGRRSILVSTVIAFVLAGIVFMTIVLPAEYGIDPTGIGKALGLTAISTVRTETPVPTVAAALFTDGEPELLPQPPEEFPGEPRPAPLKNPAVIQRTDMAPRDTVIDVQLETLEEVEMKAVLPANQVIIYSWSVSEGEVYYDFHGEPGKGPEGYFVRYAEGEGATDSGSLVAPFSGNHGWYWLNISEYPVTIHLQVNGYHLELVEVFRNQQ